MMNNSNRGFGKGSSGKPLGTNQSAGNNASKRNDSTQRKKPQDEALDCRQEEKLDNLVNKASKHLNVSPDEMKKAAQNGNMQRLLNNMSPAQAQQLQRILSDENAAKKLLSTPQAQALLRGLSKNE